MSGNGFSGIATEEKQRVLSELAELKATLAARGLFAGTSGNLSARVGAYSPERFHFAITATVYNNVVSEWFWERRAVPVHGVELIKAFNIWEEEASIDIPIVPNYADIPRIVPEVTERLDPRVPGILLRKHGIYAWGKNIAEAKKHLEAFEFLFEYVYRWELLQGFRR